MVAATGRKRQFFENLAAQSLGKAASIVVGMAVLIFVARLFGAVAVGQYAYILTFFSIMTVVSDFGTQSVFSSDISKADADANVVWGNFLVVRAVFGAAVILPAAVVAFYLRRDLFPPILSGCLLVFFLSSRFFDPLFQVFGRPWYSAVAMCAYAAALALATAGATLISPSLHAVVLAFIAANVVYTAVAFSLSSRLLRPKFDLAAASIRKSLLLSVPIGVGSIFSVINSRIDVFMMSHLARDWATGIYSAGYRFLDFASILALTVFTPLLPIFSKLAEESSAELGRTYTLVVETLAIGLIPVALAVPLFSERLVTLLFGPEFSESAKVLNILAWVGVFVFFSLVSSAVNLAVKDVAHAYWNAATAAAVNIALNLYLIPRYAYVGASYATLVSEMLLLSVCLRYVVKHIGNFISVRRWSRILIANGVLYCIFYLLPELGAAARLALGSGFYTIMVVCTGLVPYTQLTTAIQRFSPLNRAG